MAEPIKNKGVDDKPDELNSWLLHGGKKKSDSCKLVSNLHVCDMAHTYVCKDVHAHNKYNKNLSK